MSQNSRAVCANPVMSMLPFKTIKLNEPPRLDRKCVEAFEFFFVLFFLAFDVERVLASTIYVATTHKTSHLMFIILFRFRLIGSALSDWLIICLHYAIVMIYGGFGCTQQIRWTRNLFMLQLMIIQFVCLLVGAIWLGARVRSSECSVWKNVEFACGTTTNADTKTINSDENFELTAR